MLDAKAGDSNIFFHFQLDLIKRSCAFELHKGCGIGIEYIMVTPDGDVYSCHQLVGEETFRLESLLDPSDCNQPLQDSFALVLTTPPSFCNPCFARPSAEMAALPTGIFEVVALQARMKSVAEWEDGGLSWLCGCWPDKHRARRN